MEKIDETHDASRTSWVASANGHADFPLQNLPFGVFSSDDGSPRGGVAIGDCVLDLQALLEAGVIPDKARDDVALASSPNLNAFLAKGPAARRHVRKTLFALLQSQSSLRSHADQFLLPRERVTMHVPIAIGDYTDFYAGIRHAENVGKLFRPDNPLLPNYKHVPIGYHGRASSIRVSGAEVRRPKGQIKGPQDESPRFAPTARLDYEMELGIIIGPETELGTPVSITEAPDHIAGFCVLNDWSARDIQAWEYQPLGPFLAKNFLTTISPWIVTPEALAPFRVAQAPRAAGDPVPLPYLHDEADQAGGALDLSVEVLLLTPAMREAGVAPHRLSLGSSRDLYWTPAQLVTHHASGGCNLQPGDLLGTGTISGPDRSAAGSLLELTEGGTAPIVLPNGEKRTFLQDGDEIIMRAFAAREGFISIGLGEARGRVRPAA